MASNNIVKDTFEGLSPKMKLLVLVVALIVVFILFKKAQEYLEQRKLDQFSSRPDFQGPEQVRDIRPIIDQIYNKLDGVNLFIYPEVVNKIANLSDTEIDLAVEYWNNEYFAVTNKSLYDFIDGEWDGWEYDPALKKLERKGYS